MIKAEDVQKEDWSIVTGIIGILGRDDFGRDDL